MTQDEIIELARQIGDVSTDSQGRMDFSFDSYGLEAFAKLVADKERETCAKVCIEMSNTQANMNVAWRNGCREVATEIRARGQA